MAKLIYKKLDGSTLVEVTVASVIIVIVFALASTLIASLWRSGPSDRKLAAHSYLMKIADDYANEKERLDEQVLPEGLKLETIEESYPDHADLVTVTLKLHDENSGDVLEQLQFLYGTDESDKN